jgi:hypothetical protein
MGSLFRAVGLRDIWILSMGGETSPGMPETNIRAVIEARDAFGQPSCP